MTSKMIDSAMRDLTVATKDIYGDKLKEIILFGSCARGDFEGDSDVDIMILLDVPSDRLNVESSKITSAIHQLDSKYDYEMLFSPIIQSYDVFNYWLDVMPLYKNIMNEGIKYA